MKVLNRERKLCACCMTEHEVQTVQISDTTMFLNTKVSFDGIYEYCNKTDVLFMEEEQISRNDLSMKDAYRRMQNLLTSSEIRAIREKYGISQTDLSILLGWEENRISQYERHRVQSKEHDAILRKIDQNPEWFLSLLQNKND